MRPACCLGMPQGGTWSAQQRCCSSSTPDGPAASRLGPVPPGWLGSLVTSWPDSSWATACCQSKGFCTVSAHRALLPMGRRLGTRELKGLTLFYDQRGQFVMPHHCILFPHTYSLAINLCVIHLGLYSIIRSPSHKLRNIDVHSADSLFLFENWVLNFIWGQKKIALSQIAM